MSKLPRNTRVCDICNTEKTLFHFPKTKAHIADRHVVCSACLNYWQPCHECDKWFHTGGCREVYYCSDACGAKNGFHYRDENRVCKNCNRKFRCTFTKNKKSLCCLDCEREWHKKEAKAKKEAEPVNSAPVLDASAKRRFRLFLRDGFSCFWCGKSSIEHSQTLHIDHINPRSRGGGDNVGNLVTSCRVCNLSKNDILLSSELMTRALSEVWRRCIENGMDPQMLIKDVDG
jgi:hypothetical protein